MVISRCAGRMGFCKPLFGNTTNMSHPTIFAAKTLLRELAPDVNSYVVDIGSLHEPLSGDLHRFIFGQPSDIAAMTGPVFDLKFKEHLRYQWQGRGCAILFKKSAIQVSRAACLGTAIHELGHFHSFANRPERDDPDEAHAIRTFKASPSLSENEWHDGPWIRATFNLWWRALVRG